MAIINKGEVLFEGHPMQALDKVKGKIWRKFISKVESKQMHEDHKIISTKFNTGQIELHVWSDEKMNNGFEPSDPQLEDVYFSVINGLMK